MKYIMCSVILLIDQMSKYQIRAHMSYGESIPLIGDVIRVTYIKNTGGAFGLLSENAPMLKVITIVLLAALIVVYGVIRKRLGKFEQYSLLMILSGGVGNLIDRLISGFVTDFIDVWKWPVFNIADISITVGCFLLLVHVIRGGNGRKTEYER